MKFKFKTLSRREEFIAERIVDVKYPFSYGLDLTRKSPLAPLFQRGE
jgi:hypothetical protein